MPFQYGSNRRPILITRQNSKLITFPDWPDMNHLEHRPDPNTTVRILHSRFWPEQSSCDLEKYKEDDEARLRAFGVPERVMNEMSDEQFEWYVNLRLGDLKDKGDPIMEGALPDWPKGWVRKPAQPAPPTRQLLTAGVGEEPSLPPSDQMVNPNDKRNAIVVFGLGATVALLSAIYKK